MTPVVSYFVREAKPNYVLGHYKRVTGDAKSATFERRLHGVWMNDMSNDAPSPAIFEAQVASGALRPCVVPAVLVQSSVTLVPLAAIERGVSEGTLTPFAWRKRLSSVTFARVSLVSSKTPDGATYYAVEASRWQGESSRAQHGVGTTSLTSLSQATALYDKVVRERAADLGGALSINHAAAALASEGAIYRSYDLGAVAELCSKHAEEEVAKREREESEARERARRETAAREREAAERARVQREAAERERVEREAAERERALRIARGDASELTDDELRMRIRAARRKT